MATATAIRVPRLIDTAGLENPCQAPAAEGAPAPSARTPKSQDYTRR
jgi:hypothetical protein